MCMDFLIVMRVLINVGFLHIVVFSLLLITCFCLSSNQNSLLTISHTFNIKCYIQARVATRHDTVAKVETCIVFKLQINDS